MLKFCTLIVIMAATCSAQNMIYIGDSIAEGHPWADGRLHTGGNYPNQTFNLSLANQQFTPASDMASLLPTWTIVNQGIGSTQCVDTKTRWGRDAEKDGSNGGDIIGTTATLSVVPQIIVVHCGVNDWNINQTAVATMETYYTFFVNTAASNNQKVLIDTIGPNGSITAPFTTWQTTLNSWLQSTYGATSGVIISDFATFLANNPSYLNVDGIHPTETGYQVWTQTQYNAMVTAGWFTQAGSTHTWGNSPSWTSVGSLTWTPKGSLSWASAGSLTWN